MTYLSRPVFLFRPNWADAVSRSVTFDLRATGLGFGAEYFSPTQTYTVNGWKFSLLLQSAGEIAAFDAFTAALAGRLTGFWLPIPFAAARILSGADTTHFTIAGQQLAVYWDDRPDVHLFFTFADGTQSAAAIDEVVDNEDGTETVTLATTLSQVTTTSTIVERLHYVRLADDVESGEFLAEGIQARDVDVMELPLEYAQAETGLRPIYLYDFWADAPIGLHWRYTSFAAPVVSNGQIFANWPITHGEIKETTDGHDNELSIESKPDPSHPFSLFFPIPLGKPLRVRISLASYAAPDTVTNLYVGRIVKVSDQGSKYVATAQTVLSRLKLKVPRSLIGPNCPYVLYDQQTCRVGRAWFETMLNYVEQTAAQPPVLKCTFALEINKARNQAEDFFKWGLVEGGMGSKYEIRSILASHWNSGTSQLELTLNYPFTRLAPGDQLQCAAGCDHLLQGDCTNKFDNAANNASFTQIPDTNLSINALNTSNSQGGKK